MPTNKRRSKLRRRSRRRKQKRILLFGGICLACVLTVLGITYTVLYRYVNKVDKNTIQNNIYIGRVNVSGMSAKKAKEALNEELERYGQMTLTMQVGEKSAETAFSELGLSMKNPDKTVKEAVDYGKEGSVWSRFQEIRKLKKKKLVIDEKLVLDQEKAATLIREQASGLEVRAENAKIKHVSGGFEITDEKQGRKIEVEASIKAMEDYLNKEWKYENTSLKLEEVIEEPKIKRADLETIQDELGSFSTDAGSGDRVTNLRRASEMINGTVLMPGEELSVLKATLPYTKENGYVDGSAYENGQVVQNIGGGLCQVSTTLYNAVLYSELRVTERSAHSMIVTYVDPSRDAAIAEDVKDLKFVNSYDTPVLLEGYIDGNNQLRFHIYGKDTRPKNRKVEFESETLERTEYKKKFVADSGKSIGYMQNEGIGFNGRKARLWKVVYENGKQISRDVINNSTYKASELEVRVGTASQNAEASKIVSDAVKSQNEEKIRAAISQAKAKENEPKEKPEEKPDEGAAEG